MSEKPAAGDKVLSAIAVEIDVIGGMGFANKSLMEKVCLEAAIGVLFAPIDARAVGGGTENVVDTITIGVEVIHIGHAILDDLFGMINPLARPISLLFGLGPPTAAPGDVHQTIAVDVDCPQAMGELVGRLGFIADGMVGP